MAKRQGGGKLLPLPLTTFGEIAALDCHVGKVTYSRSYTLVQYGVGNACFEENVMNVVSMRVCAIAALAMQLFSLPAYAQALDPYQAMASIPDSTTCPGAQCVMHFPAVPAGKRLVVTSVSAQLGPASNELVVEGNGVSFFVPKSDPNIGYLAAPVTIYFDAGSTPSARVFAPNTTQHTSLIVTLVGHLVPH
jgi:hypothetical protein